LWLGGENSQQRLVEKVTKQNAYYSDGKAGLGGKVHHRCRAKAQAQDAAVLGPRPEVRRRPSASRDDKVDEA
jgi:hypothetical protein